MHRGEPNSSICLESFINSLNDGQKYAFLTQKRVNFFIVPHDKPRWSDLSQHERHCSRIDKTQVNLQ